MAFTIEQVQRPGARDRPQQDARRPALQRVPRVLPRQRRRVLRLLLRLLPARGVRPELRTSTSRRTPRSTRRSTACATPPRPRCSRARDVIVVASVSCIFGLGSPEKYDQQMLMLKPGEMVDRDEHPAQARRHPVHAQRHRARRAAPSASAARRSRSSRPTPRPPTAPSSSATRSRPIQRVRPAHRRGPQGARARRGLAGHALRHRPATRSSARVVEIRDELERAHQGAGGAGQAARVAPPAPAHPVRHGDAARARLLQRHRELLAHPRRPRRPASAPTA